MVGSLKMKRKQLVHNQQPISVVKLEFFQVQNLMFQVKSGYITAVLWALQSRGYNQYFCVRLFITLKRHGACHQDSYIRTLHFQRVGHSNVYRYQHSYRIPCITGYVTSPPGTNEKESESRKCLLICKRDSSTLDYWEKQTVYSILGLCT